MKSFQCSNIIFIQTYTLLKKSVLLFLKRYSENCCFKSFRKFQEKHLYQQSNSSCPICDLKLKTDSTGNVCEHFQNCWESTQSGINFSKTTGEISAFYNLYLVRSYVPKSSSASDFKKSPFNRSCRIAVESLHATKNKLLAKCSKGLLKTLENCHEEICNTVPFQLIAGAQNLAFNPTCF